METIAKKRGKKAFGRLTKRQIKNRVGEAWALLENPEYSEKEVLLSAELLYYDADKTKVHEEMSKCFGTRKGGGYFAVSFFGTIDPNTVFLL
jgi:hypothetical protein